MANFSTLWEAEWGEFFAFPPRQVWNSAREHSAMFCSKYTSQIFFFFFPPSLFFPQIFLQPRTAAHRRHRQTVSIYAQSVGPNLPKQVISCAFLYPHKHKRYLKMHTRAHARTITFLYCCLLSSTLGLASKEAEDDPEQPQQPLVRTSSGWLCGCWSRQHWQLRMCVFTSMCARTPTRGRRHAKRQDICLATSDTAAAADWPVCCPCRWLVLCWLKALLSSSSRHDAFSG